ncbi:MAG: HDIG domain-containing protein [Rikenellaceae bacterium]
MNNKLLSFLAFIVTTFILTLMLPSTDIFKAKYRIGERWSKPDIVAAYDFPILKSENEYNEDIEAAMTRFIPIYSFDKRVENNIEQQLNEGLKIILNNQINDSLRNYLRQGIVDRVKDIYRIGIIDKSTITIDSTNTTGQVIRIVKDGELMSYSLNKLLDLEQAKGVISNLFKSHDLLRDVHVERYLVENVVYDQSLNQTLLDENIALIPKNRGFVAQGTSVVKKGEVVTDKIYQQLESLKAESLLRSENQSSLTIVLGNFLYILIILFLHFTFLTYFRREFSKNLGNVLFLLFIYIFMALFTYIVSKIDALNIYLIPFAIVPFYIVTFYDIRMSIFEYVSVLLVCSPFAPEPIDFFFINAMAGLSGIFVLRNSYHRTKIMVSSGIMLLVYIFSYLAISLMKSGDFFALNFRELIWFGLNTLLFLGLYQLIYLFEHIFGFVTDITLFELCDTNHFLLRELAEKAPGTFQHSVQVANLAEAAAKEIGANPLYARTGALYHDIGKLENPLFFIENNSLGINPHDGLEPIKSVEIIKQHVSDGLKLAKKHNLPTVIIDFIMSHHAKSLIYYFYHQHKNNNPDEQIDESIFRYDGPAPSSREVTICMMADSIEAASRSLKSHDSESIKKLVDSIIDSQIDDGLFAESTLSFAEIIKVKSVFIAKIEGIYHTRIAYPKRG